MLSPLGSLLCLILLSSSSSGLWARERARPSRGLHDHTPRTHVLVGATVVTSPGNALEGATIVIRDGLIENVGKDGEIPADARVWDVHDKIVYAGFIDPHTNLGLSATDELPQSGLASWNPRVVPQRKASDLIEIEQDKVAALRKLGFVSVQAVPRSGIFRGQSAVVGLSGNSLNESVLISSANQHIGFEIRRRGGSRERYPVSLMGCIALIRQSFLDAHWYDAAQQYAQKHPGSAERPAMNSALEALNQSLERNQRFVFEARSELDFNRIAQIAAEFQLPYAILGNGYEYRQLKLLKQLAVPLVVPLAFPEAPQVENPDQALDISLEDLQHWELAPSNLAFLADREILFSITTHYLENPGEEFWKHVRLALKRGLPEEVALAALTTRPAELCGVAQQLGSIEPGKLASLVVASGNLFADEDAEIAAVWVNGDVFEQPIIRRIDPRGTWEFTWHGVEGFPQACIAGELKSPSLEVESMKAKIKTSSDEVQVLLSGKLFHLDDEDGVVRLHGYLLESTLSGDAVLPNGQSVSWSARRTAPFDPAAEARNDEVASNEEARADEENTDEPPPLVFDRYPAGAYGVLSPDETQPRAVVVRHATIWTAGPEGTLEDADLFVDAGKIVAVGTNLTVPQEAKTIDAAGMHVTPGIVDCHSHTAISGDFNEGSHVVTLEVRIGDVINPVDIALYRQLAGGVTVANALHGSSNPMGGQNQVIKLRWGSDAEGMKFRGAMPGIKFALGENVVRSNWGGRESKTYPQTRLGVEQIMRDTFAAARDYERQWQAFRAGTRKVAPRRNLRLEAALEILHGKRLVHIHSYRQDEMLMFARLAKELGFTVGTF